MRHDNFVRVIEEPIKRELNAQTHMRIKMPVACFAFDVLLHFGEACRYLPAVPTYNIYWDLVQLPDATPNLAALQ